MTPSGPKASEQTERDLSIVEVELAEWPHHPFTL
jgi:hypothetical protein